jgi:hypothetical protein
MRKNIIPEKFVRGSNTNGCFFSLVLISQPGVV